MKARLSGMLALMAAITLTIVPLQHAYTLPGLPPGYRSMPQPDPGTQEWLEENYRSIIPAFPASDYWLQPPPPGGCGVLIVQAVSSQKLPYCFWHVVLEKYDPCIGWYTQEMTAKTDGRSLPKPETWQEAAPAATLTPTVTMTRTRVVRKTIEETAWSTSTARATRAVRATIAKTVRTTETPPIPPSPAPRLVDLSSRCWGMEEWLLEATSDIYNATLRLEVSGVELESGRQPPYARSIEAYLDGYPILHIYARQQVDRWAEGTRRCIKLTLTYHAMEYGKDSSSRVVARYVVEGWVDEQAKRGHIEAWREGSIEGVYEATLGSIARGLHRLSFRVTGLYWELPEGWEDLTGGQEYVYGRKIAKADISFKLTGAWVQEPKLERLGSYGTSLRGEEWIREGWPLKYGVKKTLSYRLTRKVIYLGEDTEKSIERKKVVEARAERRYLGKEVEVRRDESITVRRYYDSQRRRWIVEYTKTTRITRIVTHRWLKLVTEVTTWHITVYITTLERYRVLWKWVPRVEERFCWGGG